MLQQRQKTWTVALAARMHAGRRDMELGRGSVRNEVGTGWQKEGWAWRVVRMDETMIAVERTRYEWVGMVGVAV